MTHMNHATYDPSHALTLATALIHNHDARFKNHAAIYHFNNLECHAELSYDHADYSYRVKLTIILPPDDADALRYILMLAHDACHILASQHFDIDATRITLNVSASDDMTVTAEMTDWAS